MLQRPGKLVGKGTCKSSRDHRMWKALGSKGLCEIEEIGKEEAFIKMMQSLERFMRSHPEVWSEPSVQHLLVEIADTQYARSENSEAEERLHTVIMRMLFPMAKIMEAEQGSMKIEKLKMQEATLALQRVQEECHHALLNLTMQHNTSAKDLEELGKALEANRLAAEEAGRKLAERENQIHLMVQQQRDLVVRLVCGGPSEFIKWAREEIESQGLGDLDKELEQSWWPFTRVPDHSDDEKMLMDLMPDPECSITISSKEEGSTCQTPNQDVYKDTDKAPFAVTSVKNLSTKVLYLMVTETFRQVEESYRSVRGPLSLPSAVAGFWMGLAGRMTCLAIVTLFPQVMQKISTTSETTEV
ncbi:hypothetical protein M758_5G170700 [Ceratodon purpureus]|uniref:Uncharacterized protein n=1 Tax=Ceratodon purpureus TaxID=3225 RepID=A0A8T0I2Q2_CERPU|nr:hypothetical protein KC19_5G178300 [Ceratodon purpureus]KAG0617184.1 hypothetical protein M758_5G170700 [Ceratodon purpureus]